MREFIVNYIWFVRHSLDKENPLMNHFPRSFVWVWSLINSFGFANDMRKGV